MKVKIIEREVLNPLAETDVLKIETNSIPKNINRLSLVNNTKPNADLILDFISKKIDFSEIIKLNKPAGAPASKEQIKHARGDLAILALGDCGSCSTWLVLDAIKLERQGTPTITICTDIFAPYARELAESYGATHLRILEIKHPITGLSEEMIQDRTETVINHIKTIIK